MTADANFDVDQPLARKSYTSKQMGDACEMLVAAELTLAGAPRDQSPRQLARVRRRCAAARRPAAGANFGQVTHVQKGSGFRRVQ